MDVIVALPLKDGSFPRIVASRAKGDMTFTDLERTRASWGKKIFIPYSTLYGKVHRLASRHRRRVSTHHSYALAGA